MATTPRSPSHPLSRPCPRCPSGLQQQTAPAPLTLPWWTTRPPAARRTLVTPGLHTASRRRPRSFPPTVVRIVQVFVHPAAHMCCTSLLCERVVAAETKHIRVTGRPINGTHVRDTPSEPSRCAAKAKYDWEDQLCLPKTLWADHRHEACLRRALPFFRPGWCPDDVIG